VTYIISSSKIIDNIESIFIPVFKKKHTHTHTHNLSNGEDKSQFHMIIRSVN
jgi:hypothetical protein